MRIIDAIETHVSPLTGIFNQAVRDTLWLWTEREDSIEDRRAWIKSRRAEGFPVLVALENGGASPGKSPGDHTGYVPGGITDDDTGRVLGYGSYGLYRPAIPGFDCTVEHSVYVAPDAQGRGVGKKLLNALIKRAEADTRLKNMVAAIDAENDISIRLHAGLGFVERGRLPKIAIKHGLPRDLVLMTRSV